MVGYGYLMWLVVVLPEQRDEYRSIEDLPLYFLSHLRLLCLLLDFSIFSLAFTQSVSGPLASGKGSMLGRGNLRKVSVMASS